MNREAPQASEAAAGAGAHSGFSVRPWRRIARENRTYALALLVFVFMAAVAPRFLTAANLTSILRGMSLSLPAAIGFTLVMISGKLDLSIGVNLTLGGMMAIGLQPSLGWAGSVLVAAGAGTLVGLANGVLVAKAKVDSFIVTLGTMIVVQGLVYMYSAGGTLSVLDFRLGQWMETPLLPMLAPRVIVAVSLAVLFEVLLQRTTVGRGLFLVGANPATAWASGLPIDRYVVGAFMVSGVLAAFGGALFAIGISTATPTMGNPSLMEVVAAVIIGGTSMAGGRGSVVKSMVALLALTMLYNGLECMGCGWEIRRITSGLVLASVVLYDGAVNVRRRRLRGRRHELMAEAQRLLASNANDANQEEDNIMTKNENTLALVVVGVVGCVAVVAVFAMFLLSRQGTFMPAAAGPGAASARPATREELEAQWAAREREVAALTSEDGQPLILPMVERNVPPRPEDPRALPKEHPLHWYDMEYSGWGVEKTNIPQSPADGPDGKRVTYLKAVDHPYQTAMMTGMEKVAKVYGIQVSYKTANNDLNLQAQQVDQAINERPDLVIISPVDAQACTPLFRKLNAAGIPVIAINLLPASEAHRYLLAWTGPDDWRQFRMLAEEFARRMDYEGNYCIVQHRPGSSPFFSRTWSVVSQLKEIAPKMKCLAMQTTDLESERSKDVVAGWITRFGDDLKGIVSADDSGTQVGINEAVKNANREDIIRVAAGNSKVGMDFVRDGRLHAITYQSAEADGAVPMKLAADWFYGRPIPPIRYLPIAIITQDNVEEYMPAQW